MKQNQLSINVPEQAIEDNLVSALEGGSNYWAQMGSMRNKKPMRGNPNKCVDTKYLPSYITTPLSEDGILLIYVEDTGITHELTRAKIMEGLKVMADKYPKHFGDLLAEDGDSTTGDVFLQCALFGEVRYG